MEKEKKQFAGTELFGKTLGVIGLGNIGVKVANTAIALGMRVIGYDPSITTQHAWKLSANVEQAHSIDNLLMQSDFVSFHVPLTNETKQMIHASRIRAAKSGIVFLNFSRDGLIDKNALLEALNDKHIRAYVSDFPCNQLKDHPRVISLPHVGASTQEAEENCAMMISKQIREYLETGAIINSVNFPAVEMPYSGGNRIAIANANVPNMVAQISTCLADAKLNIIDLINKSRGEIAYTLIDVSDTVTESIVQKLKAIQGVIQVRHLPQLK